MANDDSTIDNGRFNGVEVHHKIPTQVITEQSSQAQKARTLLEEIGFSTDSIANKIVLLINVETRDKIASDGYDAFEPT